MQSVHTDTKGNSGLFRGVFQGVVTMVQQEGVLSLWRGLAPTLWRDVPFSGKFDAHVYSACSLLYSLFIVHDIFFNSTLLLLLCLFSDILDGIREHQEETRELG